MDWRIGVLAGCLGIFCLGCSGEGDSSGTGEVAQPSTDAKDGGNTTKHEAPNDATNGAAKGAAEGAADDSSTPPPPALTPAEKEQARTDGLNLYEQAQQQMREEKFDAGYQTAQQAMAKFVAAEHDLPYLTLETIVREQTRVVVNFNMGEHERKPPAEGTSAPLSFLVRVKDNADAPTETIDFEIARKDGTLVTAALVASAGGQRVQMGLLSPTASYATIRAAVVDLLDKAGKE